MLKLIPLNVTKKAGGNSCSRTSSTANYDKDGSELKIIILEHLLIVVQ